MKTRIFHPGNSALYFENENKSLLIDGIYGGRYLTGETVHDMGMSEMPAEYREDKQSGSGIFRGLQKLLFTHDHRDHYHPVEVADYLEQCPDVAYYAPHDTPKNIAFQSDADNFWTIQEKGLEVMGIPTRHLDLGPQLQRFQTERHYCYRIGFEEESFLIAGDAILDEHLYDVLALLGRERIVCVFVNPIHLLMRESIQFLQKLQPQHIVLYHLPEADDDCMNYLSMMKHAARRHPSNLAPLTVAKHMEWITLPEVMSMDNNEK